MDRRIPSRPACRPSPRAITGGMSRSPGSGRTLFEPRIDAERRSTFALDAEATDLDIVVAISCLAELAPHGAAQAIGEVRGDLPLEGGALAALVCAHATPFADW